jgi:hypothetical protein
MLLSGFLLSGDELDFDIAWRGVSGIHVLLGVSGREACMTIYARFDDNDSHLSCCACKS